MGLSDYMDALDSLVPGEHPVPPDRLDEMKRKSVLKAVRAHSRHRPLVVTEDMTGDGTSLYALSNLAEWDEFSEIRWIRTPGDDDDVEPLDEEEWRVKDANAGLSLALPGDVPIGVPIRVCYTTGHFIDETSESIATADVEAVETLAASFYCRTLSAAYVRDSDSTIAADSVKQGSRSREYATLAKEYRLEYMEHMGLGKEKEVPPACSVKDWDVDYPDGTDRLTHPRRMR